MTFCEWFRQPWLWIAAGASAVWQQSRRGGGAAATFLERPLVTSVLIAVIAGTVGGFVGHAPVHWPNWHWPWHWPTPTPPAPPAPPGPAPSPLTQALQSAYNADADADKAHSLSVLHGLYANMAAQAPSWSDVNTNIQAFSKIKGIVEASTSGLPTAKLTHLRQAIAADFTAKFGTQPTTLIDKQKLVAELSAIAQALGEIK